MLCIESILILPRLSLGSKMIVSQQNYHRATATVVFLLASFTIFSCTGKDAPPRAPNTQPDAPAASGREEPEIATDPAFPELKGGFIQGMPEFPSYPEGTLIGSAERNRANEQNRGYRIKWTTKDTPEKVMDWYENALREAGWKFQRSNEIDDEGDLLANIEKGEFEGYLEAETEDDLTEIVVVLERR